MRGGPPGWRLGVVLTTPPFKTFMLINIHMQDACSGDKQSGDKLLPHSDLRGGRECFYGKHRAAGKEGGVPKYSKNMGTTSKF